MFKNYEDFLEIQLYGEKFLPSIFNEIFNIRVIIYGGTTDTRWIKIKNNKISKYITKNNYMYFPRNYSELEEIINQSEYEI